MTVKEIFDTKAEFNKWLKELTPSEVKLILDMLEEAKEEGLIEGYDNCEKEYNIIDNFR